MKSLKERADWFEQDPNQKKRSPREMLKAGAKYAFVAMGIGVAYFGVIAILLSPAFDIAPPA